MYHLSKTKEENVQEKINVGNSYSDQRKKVVLCQLCTEQ